MPIEKHDVMFKNGENSAATWVSTNARTTVRIPTASGDDIEAWLYLPEGPGPHPAVVMAHGIGAIKAGGLAPFAERFRQEGFAAVVFDYRQWGGSAGQPREVLSFPRQREDYRTVIRWHVHRRPGRVGLPHRGCDRPVPARRRRRGGEIGFAPTRPPTSVGGVG